MTEGVVRIYRGIPGSGKSTHADTWWKKLLKQPEGERPDNPIMPRFSADDFFMIGGQYRFDPARIGAAHTRSFKIFLEAVQDERFSHYVVDNTNISAWEIAPYVQAANAYGLQHEIITVWCDPVIAALRNVHGVPVQQVFTMYQRLMTEVLPPFWCHQIILPEEA